MAPSAITTAVETPISPKSALLKRSASELGLKPIESKLPESQRSHAQRDDNVAGKVVIHDIRGRENEFTLSVQGFQYIQHEIKGVTDWTDREQIQNIIQPATEQLVKKYTGASKTIVYLDRARNKGNREGESMSNTQSPSIGVHTDLTHASSRYSLHNIGYSPEEIERLLKLRHVVVNVWRPIKQIRRDPLALCDWRTVNPEADIFNDRRVLSDGILEFGRPVFSERHEWFYLSGQRPDEPLIFKQLDSNLRLTLRSRILLLWTPNTLTTHQGRALSSKSLLSLRTKATARTGKFYVGMWAFRMEPG